MRPTEGTTTVAAEAGLIETEESGPPPSGSQAKPWEDLIPMAARRKLRAEMTHAACLRVPSTRHQGLQQVSTRIRIHLEFASSSSNGAFEFPIHYKYYIGNSTFKPVFYNAEWGPDDAGQTTLHGKALELESPLDSSTLGALVTKKGITGPYSELSVANAMYSLSKNSLSIPGQLKGTDIYDLQKMATADRTDVNQWIYKHFDDYGALSGSQQTIVNGGYIRNGIFSTSGGKVLPDLSPSGALTSSPLILVASTHFSFDDNHKVIDHEAMGTKDSSFYCLLSVTAPGKHTITINNVSSSSRVAVVLDVFEYGFSIMSDKSQVFSTGASGSYTVTFPDAGNYLIRFWAVDSTPATPYSSSVSSARIAFNASFQ